MVAWNKWIKSDWIKRERWSPKISPWSLWLALGGGWRWGGASKSGNLCGGKVQTFQRREGASKCLLMRQMLFVSVPLQYEHSTALPITYTGCNCDLCIQIGRQKRHKGAVELLGFSNYCPFCKMLAMACGYFLRKSKLHLVIQSEMEND